MKHYVYILKCDDNSYYTGLTNNLERRLADHAEGKTTYTQGRLPVSLAYYEVITEKSEAILREKQIKKWSQKKKEAISRGAHKALAEYSKKIFHKGESK